MNSGFYKLDGELLYAPNFVYNKDFELEAPRHTEYTYPAQGWYWFGSLEEACLHFNLDIAQYQDGGQNG